LKNFTSLKGRINNMKRCISILKAFVLSASTLGVVLAADNTLATPVIEVNLGSFVSVNGSYLGGAPVNKPNPAVYQVYANAQECLRIDVVGGAANFFEATLVSPSGRTWQQSGPALIKARTLTGGWYTLQISSSTGAATTGTFTMRIGRLPANSPSCQPLSPQKIQ
jgi:hypothetical protein